MHWSRRYAAHAREQPDILQRVRSGRPAGDAGRPGSSDDDFESDAGSSANEYAEGLGCADRQRCCEQPVSGFEFDSHPREEYFAQPPPHRATAVSSDEEGLAVPPAAKRRALCRDPAADGRCTQHDILARLELLEASEAHDGRRDQSRRVSQLLSAVARHCNRRSAQRASRQEGAPSADMDSRNTCELAHSAALAALRRCHAELVSARESRRTNVSTTSDAKALLSLLEPVSAIDVDVALLRATGIGVELNRPEWKRHAVREVAARCAGLVAKWRASAASARGAAAEGRRVKEPPAALAR